MRKTIYLTLTALFCLSTAFSSEKMFIDENDLCHSDNTFYIHIGENVWISTHTITRDVSGLFTLQENITRSLPSMFSEKRWKCPYCYKYWPMNTPCQNPDCPSKYK